MLLTILERERERQQRQVQHSSNNNNTKQQQQQRQQQHDSSTDATEGAATARNAQNGVASATRSCRNHIVDPHCQAVEQRQRANDRLLLVRRDGYQAQTRLHTETHTPTSSGTPPSGVLLAIYNGPRGMTGVVHSVVCCSRRGLCHRFACWQGRQRR